MKLLRLLIFLMIFTLWVFAPNPESVRAQNAGLVSVSPAQSQVAVGSAITLELVLTDGENVNAFDLVLTYNSDLLSLTNWAYGDFLSNLADVNEEDDPGRFHLVATQLATPPVSGDGILLEITFQGLADGVSAVTITRAELGDPQGNMLLPAVSDGSVAVGDANSNPATETPVVTQTQAPTNVVTITTAPSRTPTPTDTGASTGYPNNTTPTRAATRAPTGASGPTGEATAGVTDVTRESTQVGTPGADTVEERTATAQPGVAEPSSTAQGEMGAPDATDSPTDIAEKPSVPAEQPDQGMGPMAWVALGFGAVVLGGAVLLVIRRGRKMKIDEDLL